MYYGRKKGIIITIIIVVIILILGIGGFLVYANTDLLKSNETLFLKYALQGTKNLEYIENPQLANILKLQEQEAYTLKGTANVKYANNQTQLENVEDLKVTINQTVNKAESKDYSDIRLNYKNQDIFRVEYARNDDLYALKSDEIVTAYIGIKNDNLKVLAQKIGITNTDEIPNSIEPIDINQLLSITDEEKKYIQETYLNIIMNNIPKENYSKQSNMPITKNGVSYNTTAYRLDLTSDEVKNILTTILENVKQDSITLNLIATKAKLLGLDENYTDVNMLNNTITEIISKINKSTQICKDGLSLVVYVDNGKVVTTEILIKNQAKVTIYGENTTAKSNMYMKLEDLESSDATTYEIQLDETKTSEQSTMQLYFTVNDGTQISMNIVNKGSATEGRLITTATIDITANETSSNIEYEQEMTFDNSVENNIIELNNTNCATLNDYTTEQLQLLVNALIQRTVIVLNEKVQMLGINNNTITNQNPLTSNTQQQNTTQQTNTTQENSNNSQI